MEEEEEDEEEEKEEEDDMILSKKLSRHAINISVFLQLPPCRWPHAWTKHVGGS
jgi:hypothetical protein